MKKLVIPFMLVAIIIALYEQSKDKPNVYILCIAIVIFMFGVMQLSAKTPSKNQEEEKDEDNVE
jgi:glycerol uptake facilitator-like aquaporin